MNTLTLLHRANASNGKADLSSLADHLVECGEGQLCAMTSVGAGVEVEDVDRGW
jgi:hypothetical protein